MRIKHYMYVHENESERERDRASDARERKNEKRGALKRKLYKNECIGQHDTWKVDVGGGGRMINKEEERGVLNSLFTCSLPFRRTRCLFNLFLWSWSASTRFRNSWHWTCCVLVLVGAEWTYLFIQIPLTLCT